MTRQSRIALAAQAFAALVLVAAPAARAERTNPLEGQPPVRRRVDMVSGRFEVSPGLMVSMNQDFRQFIGFGLGLQFHINDWLGIGAQVAFGGSTNTGLTGKLIGDNGDVNDANNGGALPIAEGGSDGHQPSRQQFVDHLASVKAPISAYVALTPVAGKVNMFGAVTLRYDFYVMGGLGILLLGNSWDPNHPGDSDASCSNMDPNACKPTNDGAKIGGMAGVGTHLYFNDWFGIHIELRDFIASTNPGGLDVNGDHILSSADDSISNNFFVTFGATILLPTGAPRTR